MLIGANVSKFVETVSLAAIILLGGGAIVFVWRLRRLKITGKSQMQVFRESLELRSIAFLMLVPMFYLSYHKFSLSWLLWLVLVIAYFLAFSIYIPKLRKRLIAARQEKLSK